MKALGNDIKIMVAQGWKVSDIAEFLGIHETAVIKAARIIKNITLRY